MSDAASTESGTARRNGSRVPQRSSDRILAAAAELARERGIHGATIAAVSQRSGLPASSIYWHFADKDALFAEVIRTSYAQWLTSVPRWAAPTTGPLRDGLESILIPSTSTLREVPDFVRVGMQVILDQRHEYAAAREAFLSVRAQVLAMMVSWMDAALGDETDPADSEALARLIMGFTDGLAVATQIFPDLAVHEYVELFLDMLVAAAPSVG